jgi:hypothetical protein
MLPATFEHKPDLRVSSQAIGIFAVAILAAGLSFTGLLTFAVRNPRFQAEAVYTPALTSCIAGFLTALYNLVISKRHYWNTPAYLSIVVAALCSIAYSGLLVYVRRRRKIVRHRQVVEPAMPPSPQESTSMERLVPRYQDPAYYDNYIRNMFPASTPTTSQPRSPGDNPISEEDMQRQQMLMLLQRNPVSPANASQSTFHIDWQTQDQDDNVPDHGYYAPGAQSGSSGSSELPSTISRSWTGEGLQPWDGVWRVPASMQAPQRARASTSREERRRQIESDQ